MPAIKTAMMADLGKQRMSQKVLDDPACYSCSRRAEIFQVTGNYCLQCWQDETHPDVSPSGGRIA